MIDCRARRWLLGAVTLVLASGSGCTAVDCPSGSTIQSGNCTVSNPDTVLDAATDAMRPAGGTGGAAAESGAGGASGAAGEGGSTGGSPAGSGSGGGGAGGVPAPAGSGGSGGASGAAAGDPCSSAGAVRCSALGEGKREKCTDGKWQPGEPCTSGQTCVVDAAGAGACVTRAEVCRGSGGKAVCDASGTLFVCNADESIKSQALCQSTRLCQAGVSAQSCAMCVPNDEFRCTGKTLERCAADGFRFAKHDECDTAALCNKTAGMCTDSVCAPNKVSCDANTLVVCNADGTGWKSMTPCTGGTCDAAGGDCNRCEPGSKKCDGDMVLTCDALGQTYAPSSCPSGDHCVGLGQCVDCVSNSDCTAMTQGCKVGVCAQNRCVAQNQPAGTSCSAAGGKPGVCASGECQCAPQCGGKECGDDGCTGTCAPGCSGSESCVGGQCLECQNDGQCSRLNGASGCVEGYCDDGTCKARNAPSTKSCGSAGSCRDGSCCTPSCSGKCATESNGCGGVCPNPCSGGQSCSAGVCCTPECETRCSGSNGCGGTCLQSNCSAQGLICQAGECIPPPTIGGLYQPCDENTPCNSQFVCTQVGPGGRSYCYTPVSATGTCTPPLVSFLSFVCLATCPGADADKRSPGCPAGAKICYGASADTGYCVPST